MNTLNKLFYAAWMVLRCLWDRIRGRGSACGLIVAFIVLAFASPAITAPDIEGREFRERVEDIAGFVRIATGYNYRGPIDIVVMTPGEINRIYYGEFYDEQDVQCAEDDGAICIKAVVDGGLIILGTDFELGRDDYILVHEIVHVMQFHARMHDEVPCIGATEPEAYAVQDQFVELTGRGKKSDRLSVLLLALCGGHY